MHGRVKVKTDSQKELEKRLEKEQKCKQFLCGQNRAFDKRSKGEYDSEALAITGQLLAVNPDFYTLWNFRREIMVGLRNDSQSTENSDSFEKICGNELQLTENCFRVNHKSYCVWHQRKWIIENMPNPDLRTEISLCNQLLQLDERNFHCWDYRRFVAKMAQIDVGEELEFTLQKIQQNFSNFSSWYYRSCLFTYAANNKKIDFSDQWKREYDLVENAIFTDPTDQSAWFYHKWLVSTNCGHNMKPSLELNSENCIQINRIVYSADQSLLAIGLTRPIKQKPWLTVSINEHFLDDQEWSSLNEPNSNVWFINVDSISINRMNRLTISPIPSFVRNPEFIAPIDFEFDANNDQKVMVWERTADNSDKQFGLEESYLKRLRELHELEPKNKWVNLTLAWSDPNKTQMDSIFDALIQLDPLRTNYYNDLKSKTILKERIESLQTMVSVELNNTNITALYDCNRLTHIRSLDLSQNNLLKLSKTLNHLLSLEVLIVDSNKIYAIDRDLKFNKLKVLSLNNNNISKLECLTHLRNSKKLEKLFIKSNPISNGLKDKPNSEILLSDAIQIIFSDLNTNICDNYNEINVHYWQSNPNREFVSGLDSK